MAADRSRLAGWALAASALLAVPVAQLAVQRLGLRLSADQGPRLILALTLAPLLEELVLRSLLQHGLWQWLQRRGWSVARASAAAALAATVAFALVHLDAFTLPALARCALWLVPGAALALAWGWRRHTRDCVLLHAAFNAALWWASATVA